MILVNGSDGRPRFCVDYRLTINRYIWCRKRDRDQTFQVDIDTLGDTKYISVFDLEAAHHQKPVAESKVEGDCFRYPEREIRF